MTSPLGEGGGGGTWLGDVDCSSGSDDDVSQGCCMSAARDSLWAGSLFSACAPSARPPRSCNPEILAQGVVQSCSHKAAMAMLLIHQSQQPRLILQAWI